MNTRIREIPTYPLDNRTSDIGEAVLALHCSGGNARQWRPLQQALKDQYALLTPEHYGTTQARLWMADRKLSLADEAEQSLALIDGTDGGVHLVGHSYGGALALHIALARPGRIASISLYEPCAFHLLPQLGAGADHALSEITALAATIDRHITAGNHSDAMSAFVNYWNGEGAWQGMKPEHQEHLSQWAVNANHAFDALFAEQASQQEYRQLNIPVELMLGTCSPDSVHAVAAGLKQCLPHCRVTEMPGMGHMGPLTHAEKVAQAIVDHIESNTPESLAVGLMTSVRDEYPSVAA